MIMRKLHVALRDSLEWQYKYTNAPIPVLCILVKYMPISWQWYRLCIHIHKCVSTAVKCFNSYIWGKNANTLALILYNVMAWIQVLSVGGEYCKCKYSYSTRWTVFCSFVWLEVLCFLCGNVCRALNQIPSSSTAALNVRLCLLPVTEHCNTLQAHMLPVLHQGAFFPLPEGGERGWEGMIWKLRSVSALGNQNLENENEN